MTVASCKFAELATEVDTTTQHARLHLGNHMIADMRALLATDDDDDDDDGDNTNNTPKGEEPTPMAVDPVCLEV